MEQVLDPIVLGVTNCLVEATGTARGRNYIPQSDPPLSKTLQPQFIIKILQVIADRRPE